VFLCLFAYLFIQRVYAYMSRIFRPMVCENACASVFQFCAHLLHPSCRIDTAKLHEGVMFLILLDLLTAKGKYVNLQKKNKTHKISHKFRTE